MTSPSNHPTVFPLRSNIDSMLILIYVEQVLGSASYDWMNAPS